MAKLKMVCDLCGSDEVTCDATAVWSVEDQRWELSGLLQNGTCDHCGDGVSICQETISEETVTDQ